MEGTVVFCFLSTLVIREGNDLSLIGRAGLAKAEMTIKDLMGEIKKKPFLIEYNDGTTDS